MSTIRELSDILNKAVHTENELAALMKDWNKLSRIVSCIVDGEVILTKEQWKYINSSGEFVPYAISTNEANEVIITSHVQLMARPNSSFQDTELVFPKG